MLDYVCERHTSDFNDNLALQAKHQHQLCGLNPVANKNNCWHLRGNQCNCPRFHYSVFKYSDTHLGCVNLVKGARISLQMVVCYLLKM